jgi:hypothetical protein
MNIFSCFVESSSGEGLYFIFLSLEGNKVGMVSVKGQVYKNLKEKGLNTCCLEGPLSDYGGVHS